MATQLVLITALVIGAVVKAVDLARHPREPRLSALLMTCLALLGAGQILSLPPVTHAVDLAVTTGAGKLAYNAATMAGLYTLLCFFLTAIRGRPAARRRIVLDATLLAFIIASLTLLIVATPPGYRAHTVSVPYIAYPTVALFYLVGGAYFVYAYLTSAVLTWRYARSATGTLAWALRVIVLGLAGLTLTSITRAVWVGIRFAGGPSLGWLNDINFPTSNTAFLLLTVGLVGLGVLAALMTIRGWIRDRRRYRQLAPLWTLISSTYPELVLRPAAHRTGWLDGLTGRRQYVRRIVECRDGLVRLGPYIALAAGEQDVENAPPAELAQLVVTATTLQHQPDHSAAATSSPVALAIPLSTEPADDGDVDALIAIAQALPASHR